MKFLVVTILFACAIASVSALKCITCKGASTVEQCDLEGEQQCLDNQNSCETVIRRYNNQMHVSKGCKNQQACKNNQLQNNRPSGKSTQCNGDQVNSFCTCCCDGDSCNAGLENCSSAVTVPTSLVGHDNCPAPPKSFPHGNINCENGVCKYQCTDETYGLWPVGRDQNVCGADGNWQFDTPCCARPCPPYYLYDFVTLYHFKPDNVENMFRVLGELSQYVVIGADSTMAAGLSYDSSVHLSSITNFNEYQYNETIMNTLFGQRLRPSIEGTPVNTGAAIQYAVDNMFKPENGARDSRVPKAISIVIDSNSDDDVKTAGQNARDLGYIIYVYAFEREGVVLDDQQLLDITGNKDHIFKFGSDFDAFPEDWWKDLNSHFCDDPCVHVLHDHNQ